MPRPLRLPLAFYASLPVLWVDTNVGDDNNDGLDARYPKKYITAAYDALPAAGGTIYVMDGSYVGGEVSQQGLLLTAVGTLYPGWRRLKTLRLVGHCGISTGAQLAYPAARIFPGRVGDGAAYFPPNSQFGVWFTGNGSAGGFPVVIENIIVNFRGGFRVGGNPNPAVDPYGPSGMGSDFTTALWWLKNCSTQFNGDGSAVNAQPGFHIGYCIWGNIIECTSDRPLDAEFTSDRRAGFLVKPSDGSSQVIFDHCRGTQGGIKFYAGSSSWGIDVNWYQIEGDFVHPLPPAVWLLGANKFGSGVINNASGADAGAGSMNGITIEETSNFQPSQILVLNASGPPNGPCTTMAVSEANSGNVTSVDTPAGVEQISISGGRIWGDMDFVRQVTPIITNRVKNLCPQHTGADGESGPVTNPTVIDHSSNRIWTQENVVVVGGSGTCVDAPVNNKIGTTTAIQISCADGGLAYQRLFYATRTVAVGDIFVCGLWVRFPSGPPPTGFPIGMTLTNGALEVEYHPAGEVGPAFYGDGQWSYVKSWAKVVALHGETQALPNFVVQNIPLAHPIVIDQRFIAHIPAGVMSPNEFGAFFQNLVSYVQAPTGEATTQLGQGLVVKGKFYSGNCFSVSGHVVGPVVNLMPVYDGNDLDGGLLGFLELKSLIS